jgi:hypothetical protein
MKWLTHLLEVAEQVLSYLPEDAQTCRLGDYRVAG